MDSVYDLPRARIARRAGHISLATFDRDFAKLPDVERLAG
jgi:predicted nucleic acid-binding protein